MADARLAAREDDRTSPGGAASERDLDRVLAAVRGIQFGEVRVVIQDGLIVQIDRLEKHRLR